MALFPPFWPVYMAACAALMLWGGIFKGHILAPSVVLGGLLMMRVLDNYAAPEFFEISAGAVWIFAAALLFYSEWLFAGIFLCLSGLTYPILRALGFKIETFGLAPIIADAFLICSILFIAGGIGGLRNDAANMRRHSGGFGAGVEPFKGISSEAAEATSRIPAPRVGND